MPPLLTTSQAAAKLGCSRAYICAQIADGRLRAQKIGRDWLIEEADLAGVVLRPAGRPWPPKATPVEQNKQFSS